MAFTQTPLCRDLTIFHWTYKGPSCVPPLNGSILGENTTQNEDYDSCGENTNDTTDEVQKYR